MEAQIQFFESERFRVRGYLDANDVAWLSIRDVAYGIGLARETKVSLKSGQKFYRSIRWERVNQYIAEIQERVESELIKSIPVPVDRNGFIPENLVYRLAMKVNNDIAEKFQAWLADEVIPSIRKTGLYAFNPFIEKMAQVFEEGRFARAMNPAMFCVYAHLMSNGTVKIGKATNFEERAKVISYGSGLEILDSYHTEYVIASVAAEIETACHKTFATYRTKGEYFKISFEEACAEVSERARTIIETNRVLYGDKWIDANAECDKFLSEIPAPPSIKPLEVLPTVAESLPTASEPVPTIPTTANTLSLPPEKKLDVLFKCAEMTKLDERREKILDEILFLSTGKKF